MKVFLMFPDRDFDPELRLIALTKPFRTREDGAFDPLALLPWNAGAVAQDLELETLFQAMAEEDPFVLEVSRNAVLSALEQDIDVVLYRQEILRDCLANPETIRRMHALSIEALESARKKGGWFFHGYSSGILSHSVELLQIFATVLKQLRAIAETRAATFTSAGFSRFFDMLRRELDDEYFAEINAHLKHLRFSRGVLISADLEPTGKGRNYVLRAPGEGNHGWLGRLITSRPKTCTLTIAPRDEAGSRALADLRDRGISLAANATAHSADHIRNFLQMLRIELAFYVGCLNLHDRLDQLGAPVCFPVPAACAQRTFAGRGLYDVALALHMDHEVVGNEINAGASGLIVVTGANRGGKSTFLRSVGQAQLMMQAGMFVSAQAFSADIARGVFTHFKREEDSEMKSGKLDEELTRMSAIVDHLRRDSLVLFNESFASTNEREGSEIARQITTALESGHVKVFHVTHLYEFAHRLHAQPEGRFFLRAQRAGAGGASFRLSVGAPRVTSFGDDLYQQVFRG